MPATQSKQMLWNPNLLMCTSKIFIEHQRVVNYYLLIFYLLQYDLIYVTHFMYLTFEFRFNFKILLTLQCTLIFSISEELRVCNMFTTSFFILLSYFSSPIKKIKWLLFIIIIITVLHEFSACPKWAARNNIKLNLI